MLRKYNYLGEEIEGKRVELISEEYGYYDGDKLVVNWDEESDLVDGRGFDKGNIEPGGKYTENVELPKGTRICRYGTEFGKLTTLVGTKYEKLGLPYRKETIEYHEYVVIADGISVRCIVTKGRVARMFGSEGGAIQFLHHRTIMEELNTYRLKEVYEWRK